MEAKRIGSETPPYSLSFHCLFEINLFRIIVIAMLSDSWYELGVICSPFVEFDAR